MDLITSGKQLVPGRLYWVKKNSVRFVSGEISNDEPMVARCDDFQAIHLVIGHGNKHWADERNPSVFKNYTVYGPLEIPEVMKCFGLDRHDEPYCEYHDCSPSDPCCRAYNDRFRNCPHCTGEQELMKREDTMSDI